MALLSLDSHLINLNDFEQHEFLGSGRLGHVYRYTHCREPGEFAVRFVHSEVQSHNFIHEIDIFVRLPPHPAISTFYGFNLVPQIAVCEYLPNGTLESLFSLTSKGIRLPQWTPTLKSKIIFGFAAAMCQLHSHKAVHRYLSPSNILFDANWDPKVIDFGYSRFIANSTHLSNLTRDKSIEYLAPELIEGTTFTSDVDVYSYSVIVAQIISDGAHPYPTLTTAFQIQRAVTKHHRPVIPSNTNPFLASLVEKGWDSAIHKRPTFSEILRSLLHYDEPLFPETDMTQYREYRQRVFAQTLIDQEYRNSAFDPIMRAEDQAMFHEMSAKAESNDRESQLRLGGMYERGFGVERNLETAFQCYRMAALNGQSIAMLNVGRCYLAGQGVAKSIPEARFWLEKAAQDAKLPLARCEFGVLLFKASADPAEQMRGFELVKSLAEPPISLPEAQYQLGSAYQDGTNGIVQDFGLARNYYELAVRGGVEEARVNIAGMDLEGHGGPRDIANGIRKLEEAAARNVPMAICNLGEVYSNPVYGVMDIEKAKIWFLKAVRLRSSIGIVKFAVFLRRLATADHAKAHELNEEAARYMREAAELGNAQAMAYYGGFLMSGIGVPIDVVKAKRWLTAASEKGISKAKFHLGQILYEGAGGTARQRALGIKYWREAADEGVPEAAEWLRKIGQPR